MGALEGAGVRRVEAARAMLLTNAKCRAKAAFKFSNRLLKPFISRVNRRQAMRTVRFCRST